MLLSGIVGLSMAAPAFAATSYNVQCIQTAIEKRESSYIVAFDGYYATTRSAMINRKDSLKNAMAITDSSQRKTAIKNATKNFSTTEKNARKIKRDLEKQANSTYKTEARACEI